jgi:hypothetical protein
MVTWPYLYGLISEAEQNIKVKSTHGGPKMLTLWLLGKKIKKSMRERKKEREKGQGQIIHTILGHIPSDLLPVTRCHFLVSATSH